MVTIDKPAGSLTEASDGWETSVALTNLTDTPLSLEAKPVVTDSGCELTLDESKLPAVERRTSTVSIPAGCKVADDGFDFELTATATGRAAPEAPQGAAGGAGSAPVSFDVTAAPAPDADSPDWDELRAFLVALAVLGAIGVVFLMFSSSNRPGKELQYLGTAWSFKESWLTNITVAAGLLTGIFGSSDVVNALLGEDVDGAVALATVGTAIAIALIASGTLILEATKSDEGQFTVLGLVAAAVVTAAGAFGELWVIYQSATQLDLGGLEDRIYIPAYAAMVLLAAYVLRAVPRIIKQGTTAPPPAPESDTIKAAKLIVDELRADDNVNADPDKLDELFLALGSSPIDSAVVGAGPLRPRAAML
ncbi:MAG TPA: hypothetical protein VEX36_02220 [Thermoleophilaceae bacterium]|nr:hypothetical protein [Thermoleophilaceae bacterium]